MPLVQRHDTWGQCLSEPLLQHVKSSSVTYTFSIFDAFAFFMCASLPGVIAWWCASVFLGGGVLSVGPLCMAGFTFLNACNSRL